MTALVLFLPLSIIRHRSALEPCDYRPGLGREAGLTCSESPDAAIYRVDVFQGFRSRSTLLKTPTELFSAPTGIPTAPSAPARLLGRSPDAVWNQISAAAEISSGFWSSGPQLQEGRAWQERAAGCLAPQHLSIGLTLCRRARAAWESSRALSFSHREEKN